ncbi:MAG: glycine betaine/L-proline ABC transporter ATP-binding protein [Parvibaculaceae bacterium]
MIKLSCRNLWKVYGSRPHIYFDTAGYTIDPPALVRRLVAEHHLAAAADVSFDVEEGEIFVIMGLSGSGKSTVIRCLSRLVDATAGEILLDGEDLLSASPRELIDIRRHRIGMVFQNFGLLPHLTVLENVAFPLRTQGISLSKRNARAVEMIRLVGLEGRESSYPRQLSGGQQQRVGIARSLAVQPELWFLDEPFSALDPLIRRQLQDEFLRLQKKLHKTVVFVTHDVLEAVRLADRIAIMKDGFIVQIGTPREIVLNPVDDYVAQFVADVPIARVLRATQVMDALPAGDDGLRKRPSIAQDANLESAIAILGQKSVSGTVVDEAGRPVGLLTMDRIVHALSSRAAASSPVIGQIKAVS